MAKKPPTNRPNGADGEKSRKPRVRRSIEARLADLKEKEEKLLRKQWMDKLKDDDSEDAKELRAAIAQVKSLRAAAEILDGLEEDKLAKEVRAVADALNGDIQRDIKTHASDDSEDVAEARE